MQGCLTFEIWCLVIASDFGFVRLLKSFVIFLLLIFLFIAYWICDAKKVTLHILKLNIDVLIYVIKVYSSFHVLMYFVMVSVDVCGSWHLAIRNFLCPRIEDDSPPPPVLLCSSKEISIYGGMWMMLVPNPGIFQS